MREWSALTGEERNYSENVTKQGGGGGGGWALAKALTTAVKQAGLPARTQGARLKHGHMHNTGRSWVRVGGGDAQVGKNEHQRVSLKFSPNHDWVGPSGSGSDLGTQRCCLGQGSSSGGSHFTPIAGTMPRFIPSNSGKTRRAWYRAGRSKTCELSG